MCSAALILICNSFVINYFSCIFGGSKSRTRLHDSTRVVVSLCVCVLMYLFINYSGATILSMFTQTDLLLMYLHFILLYTFTPQHFSIRPNIYSHLNTNLSYLYFNWAFPYYSTLCFYSITLFVIIRYLLYCGLRFYIQSLGWFISDNNDIIMTMILYITVKCSRRPFFCIKYFYFWCFIFLIVFYSTFTFRRIQTCTCNGVFSQCGIASFTLPNWFYIQNLFIIH